MKSAFIELLRSPEGGQHLRYDNVAGQLIAPDGVAYPMLGTVPVLLQSTGAAESLYREHYETDAQVFDYFSDWDPVTQEENNRLHQQILNKIPAAAEWILDVGCGGAWLAGALTPKGRKVISMDISTGNPTRALQEVAQATHYGLVADVYALPFAPNSLDCIVAAEIIEHVPDPASFLECLMKVLKPGGTLIVTTPYDEKIHYSLCIHCNQRTPHNAHLHSFTEATLKQLLPAGSSTVQTKVTNSKLLVNLRLQKLLQFLPFSAWDLLDRFTIKLVKKAHRLMMVARK